MSNQFTSAWWRGQISGVVLPFVITRLFLTCIGLTSVVYLSEHIQPDCNDLSQHKLINIWSHWDARWYLSIAQHGYTFATGEQCNVAFAPLYPMLMRAGGAMLGSSTDAYLISGIVISNLCLLIGLSFVYRLAAERFDAQVAFRACLYVLICPGTLYLSAVYPMSLFLAIAAGAVYYAQHRRWTLAMCIACLAPMARPDGALLILPLAVEWFLQWRKGESRLAGAVMLAPLVIASFIWPAYLLYQFGDGFAFVKAQSAWHASPFWTVFYSSRAWLFLGTTVVFALLTLMSWWKLCPSHAAFATTFLLMMISAARFWSIVRFLVILFPAFIVLAWLGRNKIVHIAYVVLSSIIAACLMVRFALGFWVA